MWVPLLADYQHIPVMLKRNPCRLLSLAPGSHSLGLLSITGRNFRAMAPSIHVPDRKWVSHLTLAAICIALAGGLACPRDKRRSPNGVFYSPKYNFLIPFSTDPNDKRIKSVILHVSEDQGRTYSVAATATAPGPNARPEDKVFRFNATKDGLYYFIVQTQEFNDALHPPKLDNLRPGLKVCVDTEA